MNSFRDSNDNRLDSTYRLAVTRRYPVEIGGRDPSPKSTRIDLVQQADTTPPEGRPVCNHSQLTLLLVPRVDCTHTLKQSFRNQNLQP